MGIPDQVLIGPDRIQTIIPQRMPIVMVDALVSSEGTKSVAALEVREDNIFCENGRLSEAGIIEHIAQSAAAHAGYTALVEKKDVRIGFIAAIKDLIITELPPVGAILRTTITIENEVMGVIIVKGVCNACGECSARGGEIARCEMKIFIVPEEGK
jgi:predicted hotdog family 3-hydroxylacyl-ACP dehydratase